MSEHQKSQTRKALRTNALLKIDGAEPNLARTLDIAEGGMSVGVGHQLMSGQRMEIAFDMFFNGQHHKIAVSAQVTHCTYNSRDGFRVALQFLNISSSGANAIAQFMKY